MGVALPNYGADYEHSTWVSFHKQFSAGKYSTLQNPIQTIAPVSTAGMPAKGAKGSSRGKGGKGKGWKDKGEKKGKKDGGKGKHGPKGKQPIPSLISHYYML